MWFLFLHVIGAFTAISTSPTPFGAFHVSNLSNTTSNRTRLSTADNIRMSSNGTMYAARITHERNYFPSISSGEEELLIVGQDLQNISEVWLHPSPSCDVPKDNRAMEMKISDRSTTFIITHLVKEEQYRDEWKYPIYICTLPSTGASEFQSVIIRDTRDPMLLVLYIVYCFFLLLSALFTGLNLSLMSLDIDDLRRIKEYDEDPKTRRYAANIIPIRENGNFILCTILFGNNICNIICVLTFDQMFSHLPMSKFDRILFINIVPAMFTVTFAEVIPQVIFTKYALSMGSRFRYLMVFFIVITFPASYPLAKLLDLIVGREMRTTMDKRILGGLIRQQKYENENMADVVENAMNLQVRRVRDVMTPLEKVFMISDKTEVNSNLKKELNANRHTRIPVFKGEDRNCIIGILNVKDLLLIDDSLDIHVGMILQLWHRSTMFRFVNSETPVAQLMLELKKGFPLAIVVDYRHDKMNYSVVGIVTLEDNLEEVIGEIYDEKDLKLKNRSGEKSDEKSVAVDASAGLAADGLTLKMSKKKKHTGLSTEELLPDEHAPLLAQGATASMKK